MSEGTTEATVEELLAAVIFADKAEALRELAERARRCEAAEERAEKAEAALREIAAMHAGDWVLSDARECAEAALAAASEDGE